MMETHTYTVTNRITHTFRQSHTQTQTHTNTCAHKLTHTSTHTLSHTHTNLYKWPMSRNTLKNNFLYKQSGKWETFRIEVQNMCFIQQGKQLFYQGIF